MAVSTTLRTAIGLLLLSMSLLAGGLGACSREELSVRDAWIPEAPPRVSALAGYMRIDNGSGKTLTLVGATGADVDRVEIHRTVYEKDTGLARMIPQAKISLAPGESFVFEPGGYHLMLMNPRKGLKEGEIIPITLIFDDGSRPRVDFAVRGERLRR